MMPFVPLTKRPLIPQVLPCGDAFMETAISIDSQ